MPFIAATNSKKQHAWWDVRLYHAKWRLQNVLASRKAILMFRCEDCGRVYGPGVSSQKVAIETRKTSYPARYAYRGKTFADLDELQEMVNPANKYEMERAMDSMECIDAGGEGYETVREITVCEACAEKRQ